MFIVISTLTRDQTLSKDKSTLQLYNISHRVYLLHIFTLESRNPFATSHYITNAQKSTVVGLFLFFVGWQPPTGPAHSGSNKTKHNNKHNWKKDTKSCTGCGCPDRLYLDCVTSSMRACCVARAIPTNVCFHLPLHSPGTVSTGPIIVFLSSVF